VKTLADHAGELADRLAPKVAYVDLDGTLLGPGGSLFASPDGGITDVAAAAVAALHRAGIALVPTSGRTEPQVREVARVVGAEGYIAELGGIVVRDGAVERRLGEATEGVTPVEAMVRSGGAGLVLERYADRLELHTPWALEGRDVTLLLRGEVAPAEASDMLERTGYGWIWLQDNGIIHRRFPGLDLDEVHVYHLAPRGVSKRDAVAADLENRGLRPEQAVVIGDAPTDVEASDVVGAGIIVANGAWAASDGVYVTTSANGEGFAEAVDVLLASV
jgi:hydroxymethylpyrimidine pyrophosphatase-like HAD family hydrolase